MGIQGNTLTDRDANTRSLMPRPFLKWVGGKGQLIAELIKRVPSTFDRYYEPFVGGGALFFALQPKYAYLSDINNELVNVYSVIKNDVEVLIESLARHVYQESYFYQLRAADRDPTYMGWTPVEKASRLIYLNKTCYNGLYRVNSNGYFNTPFGSYRNPTICDAENLWTCSQALQETEIRCDSYLTVERNVTRGDFVYFDPPYAPLTTTSSFTGYSKNGFRIEEQEALRDLCVRLDKKGVKWMLSNSWVPLILNLYKDYNCETVQATRAINSKGEKRGKIEEAIIRNYGY